ncbi:MAG: hypothetical protein KDE26_03425 [Bacteroidetes bacterium]|nr:hypothetical protein [Bacteroidota bacterium]MCB0842300.1 hypothetical protein [Bacteroidota bacterium]
MKKLFFSLGMLWLIPILGLAQNGINYQGVVRDGAGVIIGNQNVDIKFSILEETKLDTLYSETETLTTNGFGLINHVIGSGTVTSTNSLKDVDWIDKTRYLNVQLKLNGGSYQDLGTSQIVLSPWAGNWERKGDSIIYQLDRNVGIGEENPLAKLHIVSESDVTLSDGGGIILGDINSLNLGLDQNEIMARNNGQIALLHLQASGGDIRIHAFSGDPSTQMWIKDDGRVGIGIISPSAKLHVNGDTKTKCLEITGGCDITEPFEMAETQTYLPGSVVIIDPQNPGKLTLSNQAYDPKVAGIISGAGDVNPGLILSQDGLMDQGQQIALAGRVYVRASVQNGIIQPGDLLTTADIPGFAMKATDQSRAFGTIIGKAMTGLETGEGLVLVLVNLQ